MARRRHSVANVAGLGWDVLCTVNFSRIVQGMSVGCHVDPTHGLDPDSDHPPASTQPGESGISRSASQSSRHSLVRDTHA